ncbi:hypothetical protein VTO42DRAFT_4964 [Malbranchea cinnamomea]
MAPLFRLSSPQVDLLKASLPRCMRLASTMGAKKEGDISSVFVSLSGGKASELPSRFTDVKKRLIQGREDEVKRSWDRLLDRLKEEIEVIKSKGSDIIPIIEYKDIRSAPKSFGEELRKRGVAVIRGVVPEKEARSYKEEIEEYVRKNPGTKAFPQHDPQVFELYWSKPQIRARAHPNMIDAQRFLMSFWHSNKLEAMISPSHPLAYADRLRIRQPGDTGFALGPHVDGGSVERWEENGYGLGGVYEKIWQGRWEEYDPWEADCRVPVVSDLYNGAGACSMFRMFQGWLSMSRSGPFEGTLLVNPILSLSTAYFLLRPFFTPVESLQPGEASQSAVQAYLSPSNWILESSTTSTIQGGSLGHTQELNETLHPHLELSKTMVHVPETKPGDYVAWHCDTIHAVDKVHQGKGDSSVLYIPACPLTETNVKYVQRQKEAFIQGTPGPDFPGGKGESEHIGRANEAYLREVADVDALRAFGFEAWDAEDPTLNSGHIKLLRKANQILGFP